MTDEQLMMAFRSITNQLDEFRVALDKIQEQQKLPEEPKLVVQQPILNQQEAKEIWMRGLQDWSSDKQYVENEIVKYDGEPWVALPDVALGYAPDEVYDVAARTGGWMPFPA